MNRPRTPDLIAYLLDTAGEGHDFTAAEFALAIGVHYTTAREMLVTASKRGWVTRHRVKRGRVKGQSRYAHTRNYWRSAIIRRIDVGELAERSAREILNGVVSQAQLRRALGKS